jgi:hypothetical protein
MEALKIVAHIINSVRVNQSLKPLMNYELVESLA